MKITFVNRVLTQALEVIYHPDIDEDDDSDYDQEGSDVKCNYIQLAPSNYISSSDVHSHSLRRRMIGEELPSFTLTLR